MVLSCPLVELRKVRRGKGIFEIKVFLQAGDIELGDDVEAVKLGSRGRSSSVFSCRWGSEEFMVMVTLSGHQGASRRGAAAASRTPYISWTIKTEKSMIVNSFFFFI